MDNPGDIDLVLDHGFEEAGCPESRSDPFTSARLSDFALLPLDNDQDRALLVDVLVETLEELDLNLSNPDAIGTVLDLTPRIAGIALDILRQANGLTAQDDLAQLGDSLVLLSAALLAARGCREDADFLLVRAAYLRPNQAFGNAAAQLRYLMLPHETAVVELLLAQILDGLDHPEIWAAMPAIVGCFPSLSAQIERLTANELNFYTEMWSVVYAVCIAAEGRLADGLRTLEPIAVAHSQSTLVQGAYFHLKSLAHPDDPKFDLSNRFCSVPFDTLDVLDGKSHLCCASWLPESVGDLAEQPWQDVWNSDTAQAIRNSIHDGSYRYCNKTACPLIAGGKLPTKAQASATSPVAQAILDRTQTLLPSSPRRVNLAYDMTCNLSCPSCRTGIIAAGPNRRARFDKLQDEAVLPMLKHSELVFVTGSGDPFASKNFRNLLHRLDAETYPNLRFLIMTNAMLLTPREWKRFPTLHGRVAHLRISLDAASGPVHESIRRGARWEVMERNLSFAAELRAAEAVQALEFVFTVQTENFREMPDFVDLGIRYGADHVGFSRLTNWGTFTAADYADRAVFMPTHPQHAAFRDVLRDPRLRHPTVVLNDLAEFSSGL
ncbi:MAG: SPASM domain-containing protein [Rhizorhabdus sp.]|uniref:SPASM domain-containing protein n=2 Tax=Rhizorhabdus sp. TaxID=1968843 RepID=UPI001B637049|nr:SPASM domain-containing protein [Rhizorhabdus sp.]MBP8231171.1 SPASM domain-containing protein [Rhizorhabdus sp.]